MGIAFTKRYIDKSTALAFRFQFYCDRTSELSIDLKEPKLIKTASYCSYSYLSAFQPNAAGAVAKVVQAANILINSAGKDSLTAAGEALNLAQKDKYWDEALTRAIAEAKPHFRLCQCCNRWVCAQNCWREEDQMCAGCLTGSSPNELNLTKAQQFFSKVWENVQSAVETNRTKATSVCPHCGEKDSGGKYCGICGKPQEKPEEKTEKPLFCGHCGKQLDGSFKFKFCPDCGDSLDYLPE